MKDNYNTKAKGAWKYITTLLQKLLHSIELQNDNWSGVARRDHGVINMDKPHKELFQRRKQVYLCSLLICHFGAQA